MKSTANLLLVLSFLLITSGGLVYGQGFSSYRLTYFIPKPEAQHVSPTTSLAIREGSPLHSKATTLNLFVVTGSESGLHSGRATLSDDQQTLLFYPDEPFTYGETVSVTIRPGLTTAEGKAVAADHYQFTIIDRPITQFPSRSLASVDVDLSLAIQRHRALEQPYRTYPEWTNLMTTTVTTPAQDTADGLIFIAAMGANFDGQRALMILDNKGEPIYIKPTPDDQFVTNFTKQTVNGIDYLTYNVGIPLGTWTNGSAFVMNDRYEVIDSWTIGNGYGADEHELLLLDNGHALMMSYTPISNSDLVSGTLIDIVIQEQDSNKNVVFEWHGSQHIPITDTYVDLDSDTPVDYLHTNAIEVDDDGHLLISSRNTSEVTKINRQTGEIIWRLGGKSNQFTFLNDQGFWAQHDIRRLENGNITLFDNGNNHSPPHSRAIEYAIDEMAMTITRIWQYPDDTSEYSPFMANFQRLSNGNGFIGWGAQPKLSEVLSNGTLALEMQLGGLNYRAFRFPWNGMPTQLPRTQLLYDTDPTTVTLYISWNGATDITGYEVYSGPNGNSMSLLSTVARTGFETEIPLTGLATDTCFFQLRPVHNRALPTPYSRLMFRLDMPVCLEQLSFLYLPVAFR